MCVAASPMATVQPPKLTIDMDHAFSLICVHTGLPPFHVRWKKNGRSVSTLIANYTILSAMVEHAGNYSCVASNQHGMTESAVAEVIVRCECYSCCCSNIAVSA